MLLISQFWEFFQVETLFQKMWPLMYKRAELDLRSTNTCYGSVKCKSNLIELFHKVIKSAPKHKR